MQLVGRSGGLLGGLLGSASGFGPDDLSTIPSSCATLWFLRRWIQFSALNKGGSLVEYQLYGCKPWTILKTAHRLMKGHSHHN